MTFSSLTAEVTAPNLRELFTINFKSFLDTADYLPADSLFAGTRRYPGSATILVVVGSPGLYEHRTNDWVEAEIDAYLAANATNPKILVIEAGGSVEAHPNHPIAAKVRDFIRISTPVGVQNSSLLKEATTAVRAQLGNRGRDQRRLRIFQAIAAVLLVLAVTTTAAAVIASRQRNAALQAEAQATSRLQAELRQSDLRSDRQRDALALAVRDVDFAQRQLGIVPSHTWNALRSAVELSREIGRFTLPREFSGGAGTVLPHPTIPDRIVLASKHRVVTGTFADGRLQLEPGFTVAAGPAGSSAIYLDPRARFAMVLDEPDDSLDASPRFTTVRLYDVEGRRLGDIDLGDDGLPLSKLARGKLAKVAIAVKQRIIVLPNELKGITVQNFSGISLGTPTPACPDRPKGDAQLLSSLEMAGYDDDILVYQCDDDVRLARIQRRPPGVVIVPLANIPAGHKRIVFADSGLTALLAGDSESGGSVLAFWKMGDEPRSLGIGNNSVSVVRPALNSDGTRYAAALESLTMGGPTRSAVTVGLTDQSENPLRLYLGMEPASMRFNADDSRLLTVLENQQEVRIFDVSRPGTLTVFAERRTGSEAIGVADLRWCAASQLWAASWDDGTITVRFTDGRSERHASLPDGTSSKIVCISATLIGIELDSEYARIFSVAGPQCAMDGTPVRGAKQILGQLPDGRVLVVTKADDYADELASVLPCDPHAAPQVFARFDDLDLAALAPELGGIFVVRTLASPSADDRKLNIGINFVPVPGSRQPGWSRTLMLRPGSLKSAIIVCGRRAAFATNRGDVVSVYPERDIVSAVTRDFEGSVSLACSDTGDLAVKHDLVSRYNLVNPDGGVSEELPAPSSGSRFAGTDPTGALLWISSDGVEGNIASAKNLLGLACARLAVRGAIQDEETVVAVARVCDTTR